MHGAGGNWLNLASRRKRTTVVAVAPTNSPGKEAVSASCGAWSEPDSLATVPEELAAILPRSHQLLIYCFDEPLVLTHQFLAHFSNTIFNIGGLIFKDKPDLHQAVTALNLDRPVVETDAPFLPPLGTPPKRKHHWNVYQIIREMSVIKNVPPRVIINATRRNVKWLFCL